MSLSPRDRRLLERAFEGAALQDAKQRRGAGEPMSHILGKRAFWRHEFRVTRDVLDPRPDTETLVEAALEAPFTRVLDLGTGSGCILISLLDERPGASGQGVDLSEPALAIARENATRIGVSDRATFVQSDWFDAVQGRFDLVVSNPPYIDADSYATLDPSVRRFEPKLALSPGGDGLAAYRVLASQAADYLLPDGRLILEIGWDQAESVPAVLEAHGWGEMVVRRDLNGHPRVILAQRRAKSTEY